MLSPDRLKCLVDFDIEAARRWVPTGPRGEPMTDEGLLAGMHKVRLHSTQMTTAQRVASLEWLRARNYSDLYGSPLPTTIDKVKEL